MFWSRCIWVFYVHLDFMGFWRSRCSSSGLIYVGMGNLSKILGGENRTRVGMFWEDLSF